MPERVFKYHTTDELVNGVKELGKQLASATGTTTALKNSHTGFLKETGPVTQAQLRNYYMLGRYEIYLRGQGIDGKAADRNCLAFEPTNPLTEKKMSVRSIVRPSFPFLVITPTSNG